MLANDRPSARRHPTRRNPVPPLNRLSSESLSPSPFDISALGWWVGVSFNFLRSLVLFSCELPRDRALFDDGALKKQFFHCLLILDTSQPVLAHPSRVAPSLFRIVAAPLFSDTRDHVLTGFFSFISISFIILFLTFTPLFCSAQKPRPLFPPSHLPPPFRRLRLE